MVEEEREFVVLHVRAPKTLKDLMEQYILADTHINISELIRASIREKIQRDAPHLIRDMMREE